jgi:hypothetical protein
MSIHRYPLAKLVPDYLRGAAGLVISAGAFSLVPFATWPSVIFGGLTGLFLLFTIRTALRHQEQVDLGDDAISVSGPLRGERLQRHEIDSVGLRYYATRRSRAGGWMTLKLRTGRRSITVDSTLDGFDAVALWAARATRENAIALNETTLANFAALNIDLAQPGAGWRDIGAPAEASR